MMRYTNAMMRYTDPHLLYFTWAGSCKVTQSWLNLVCTVSVPFSATNVDDFVDVAVLDNVYYSQNPNWIDASVLAILTIWSLFNPLAILIGYQLFSPTNHLLIENHRSLIQICITPSLESTPSFIPSASPVMSRLTSSFTCQLFSIIITTLITLSLQAQNLPF